MSISLCFFKCYEGEQLLAIFYIFFPHHHRSIVLVCTAAAAAATASFQTALWPPRRHGPPRQSNKRTLLLLPSSFNPHHCRCCLFCSTHNLCVLCYYYLVFAVAWVFHYRSRSRAHNRTPSFTWLIYCVFCETSSTAQEDKIVPVLWDFYLALRKHHCTRWK